VIKSASDGNSSKMGTDIGGNGCESGGAATIGADDSIYISAYNLRLTLTLRKVGTNSRANMERESPRGSTQGFFQNDWTCVKSPTKRNVTVEWENMHVRRWNETAKPKGSCAVGEECLFHEGGSIFAIEANHCRQVEISNKRGLAVVIHSESLGIVNKLQYNWNTRQ
jgi:hypothetical protein